MTTGDLPLMLLAGALVGLGLSMLLWRVRPAQVEPQQSPSAPAPAAIGKTCSQASLLLRPMCVVEGAATFWKCAPNGKRWDNNIPGCRRGNDNDGLNR